MKYLSLLLATVTITVGTYAANVIDSLALEKDAPETTITSLAQIEKIAHATQNQFWQLIPPSGNDLLYIHPDHIVRSVDWKSKEWPRTVLKQMFAEMKTVNSSMYPVYKLTVVESRTGELLWYNSLDQLIWQTPAPFGYNEYLFAFQAWNVDSVDDLDSQQLKFGRSSNVGLEVILLPQVFIKSYEEDVVQESQAMAMTSPMSMAMMSMSLTVTNLVMDIGNTNGMTELEIGWPAAFENRIDIFGCTDLVSGNWGVVAEKLPTLGTSSLVWLDLDSSSLDFRAYWVGDADLDSDGDFLPDSHELVIYHSLTNSADSDGGAVPDGYEAAFGMDPNDASDDAAALAAYQAVAGDADLDGRPQWLEGAEGTNPYDRFDY